MPNFSILLLICLVALWLFAHQSVKRRFAGLKANLPAIHGSAIIVPPDEGHPPPLAALCIDLMRRSHCTDPYETLSLAEQRMVLHAHALEVVPAWMSRYAALGLSKRNRTLIAQLRHVQDSRPHQKPQHYGAVKALLRSREEN